MHTVLGMSWRIDAQGTVETDEGDVSTPEERE